MAVAGSLGEEQAQIDRASTFTGSPVMFRLRDGGIVGSRSNRVRRFSDW